MKRLVYLHGFRSSPQSEKAKLLARYWQRHHPEVCVIIPELAAAPTSAMAQARTALAGVEAEHCTLVGSSLGGYYATWLAQQIGCRCVCLNPAIRPIHDLAAHLGRHQRFGTLADYPFLADDLAALAQFSVDRITRPGRYLLIAATGDEIIDWRLMTSHYAGARMRIVQGSDHALSGFETHLPAIAEFCNEP